MTNKVDKLRKARNIGEVMDIVKDIEKESKKNGTIALNLKSVLASTSNEEFKIEHSSKKPGKIEITTFKMPNKATIKKNSDLVKSLYLNGSDLEAAEAVVKSSFSGQKGSKEALLAIATLKQNVEQSLIAAFATLEDLATKHQPKELEKLVSKFALFTEQHLEEESFKEISREIYVTIEEDEIHFCNYLNIEGLKDVKGFVSEDYFVVLTASIPVVGGDMKLNLTSLHEFRPPGKYNLGRQVSDFKSCTLELKKLLAHDSYHVLLDQKPLSLDDEKSFTKIEGVKDVVVEDDVLKCLVNSSVKDINEVVVKVLTLLKSVVGNKSKIRHKIVKDKKQTTIEFMLTSNIVDKNVGVNIHKLDTLKDMLDLTDDEVKAVKKALRDKTN